MSTTCILQEMASSVVTLEQFSVGEVVMAGRPPLCNCKQDDDQCRGIIQKILSAFRRVPMSYEMQFVEPDKRTGETTTVREFTG